MDDLQERPFMPWLAIVVVVVIGLLVLGALRPRCAVRIVAGPRGVIRAHGLSRAQHAKVDEFFRNDLALEQTVTVIVNRSEHGGLHVKVGGVRHSGVQQQIRNFLKIIL
ncbi:MAG: hypothetical protein CMJ48_00565 [Planctomycetaceae bacterium]|nr:hypothetical protein [Planctomycetaceae bacterium]